jgi:hypothetical protein
MYKDDIECPECGWPNEQEIKRQDKARQDAERVKRRRIPGQSGADTKKQ